MRLLSETGVGFSSSAILLLLLNSSLRRHKSLDEFARRMVEGFLKTLLRVLPLVLKPLEPTRWALTRRGALITIGSEEVSNKLSSSRNRFPSLWELRMLLLLCRTGAVGFSGEVGDGVFVDGCFRSGLGDLEGKLAPPRAEAPALIERASSEGSSACALTATLIALKT